MKKPFKKLKRTFSVSYCPEDYPFAYHYFDENDSCCQSDPGLADYCDDNFIECEKDFCHDHKADSDTEQGTLFLSLTFL